METLTKRILAIVLIVVIGVGIGITVWVFVAPYAWGAKDCPGAPTSITEDQIIKIGVLSDIGEIQGDGSWEGSTFAAKRINQAGGITFGGKTYYIGVVREDTDEASANLDITRGVAAAQRMINYYNPHYILGGFRSEALFAYQEPIMDARIPFINIGAATNDFCDYVLDNYARYKYFFRCSPINGSSLAKELFGYLIPFAALNGATNFGILYEDLVWTRDLVAGIKAAIPAYGAAYGLQVVASVAYPITVTQTQMDGYISQLVANNTQIVIPCISAQGGILMMNSYGTAQPPFVIIGIDVQSQEDEFWGYSNQACLYETVLSGSADTDRTYKSAAYWAAYQAEYGHTPLYTSGGAYEAVNLFAHAINMSHSLSRETMVTTLEGIDVDNYYTGVASRIAFTRSHDILEGWPYGHTLFVQWQPGASRIVVPSYGVYPDWVATGTYQFPSWSGWWP